MEGYSIITANSASELKIKVREWGENDYTWRLYGYVHAVVDPETNKLIWYQAVFRD